MLSNRVFGFITNEMLLFLTWSFTYPSDKVLQTTDVQKTSSQPTDVKENPLFYNRNNNIVFKWLH